MLRAMRAQPECHQGGRCQGVVASWRKMRKVEGEVFMGMVEAYGRGWAGAIVTAIIILARRPRRSSFDL